MKTCEQCRFWGHRGDTGDRRPCQFRRNLNTMVRARHGAHCVDHKRGKPA